jgi:hypothetical protein
MIPSPLFATAPFNLRATAKSPLRIREEAPPDSEAVAWERGLEELRKHREKHGHVRVQVRRKEDAALGKWLVAQREEYRAGRLAPERAKRLQALGVAWPQPRATECRQWIPGV